jgi:hypothetical protein
MATRKQQIGYAKVSELRRKLRETPDLVEKYVRPAMENAAQAVMYDMIDMTPEHTGELKRRMSYKLSRDGMAALVGPEAKRYEVFARFRRAYGRFGRTKSGVVATVATKNKIVEIGEIFYFRFLDSGTKGFQGTYTNRQGTKVQANIPAMPALNIRERALDANSNYGKKELAFAIKKALIEAANRRGGA